MREAILRNARAAHREQLRNRVISQHPGMSPEQVEVEVNELVREVRAAGGRISAARRAAKQAIADEVLAAVPQMIADAEAHLGRLRTLASLVEDVA